MCVKVMNIRTISAFIAFLSLREVKDPTRLEFEVEKLKYFSVIVSPVIGFLPISARTVKYLKDEHSIF